MDSNERGMNSVAITIINSRKEYWPILGSNQQPPVLKSATLPTELWGWAGLKKRLIIRLPVKLKSFSPNKISPLYKTVWFEDYILLVALLHFLGKLYLCRNNNLTVAELGVPEHKHFLLQNGRKRKMLTLHHQYE